MVERIGRLGDATEHPTRKITGRGARLETMQGFNIRRWSAQGLEFFAISDINGEELQEFAEKFDAALHPSDGT